MHPKSDPYVISFTLVTRPSVWGQEPARTPVPQSMISIIILLHTIPAITTTANTGLLSALTLHQ